MEWLELKIDTSPSGLDAVTELLEQQLSLIHISEPTRH